MTATGASPKRRRTDNGPVSAEAIAQSNATLRQFTGNRQNRWMQGAEAQALAGGTGRGVSSDANGRRDAQTDGGPGPGQNSNSAAREGSLQSSTSRTMATDVDRLFEEASAVLEGPRPGRSDRGRVSDVVEYELPSSAAPPAMGAQEGRKSLESGAGTGTAAGQGLPSPAPSDENNTNSPRISNGTTRVPEASTSTGKRRGRPPLYTNTELAASASPRPRAPPPILSNQASSTNANAQSPNMMQYQSNLMTTQQVIQQYGPIPVPLRQASISSTRSQNSPRLPSQAAANAPLNNVRFVPPTVPSNANFQPAPAPYAPPYPPDPGPTFVPPQRQQSSPMQPQPQSIPQPLSLSQIMSSQHFLHGQNGIEAQSARLRNANPTHTKLGNDNGRLVLLQEAVVKNDWFYIILSQLFCLRSTDPTYLPQSIKAVKDESWKQLEALLCENKSLWPPNVHWFARFPLAITDFSTHENRSLRDAWEADVRSVANFLNRLPQQWPNIVTASKQRQAPPLVEDMVDTMSLRSPVLQTTAFRAIARLFWANSPLLESESGILKLVELHEADQRLYQGGVRRKQLDKMKAYVAYNNVYKLWRKYDAAVRAQAAQHPQGQPRPQPPPFQMSAEVLAPFGLCRQPPPPQFQLQQQARASPQQQQQALPPTHQRQGSAQQTHQRTPSQQQQPANVHNVHAAFIAQQQAWMRASQQSAVQTPQLTPGGPVPGAPSPVVQSAPKPRAIIPGLPQCPRPQPTHPDSARSAIHQAKVRSPVLKAMKLDDVPQKMYRHVDACALSPTRVKKDPFQQIKFNLSQDCIDQTRQVEEQKSDGTPWTATVTESSKMYRLRCVAIDVERGFPTLSSWVEADNVWPEALCFSLNNTDLQPRKKLQHGRYLPSDLTRLVRAGENVLTIAVNHLSQEKIKFDYAVAVEVVSVSTHQSILDNIQTISAKESLDAIKKSLSGDDKAGDDDEIMALDSIMTINLFDPISCCKIFDIPVRGEGCLHRDCFDLEIYLSIARRPPNPTKPSKTSLLPEEQPSVVDTWKCPICRKDARPQTLIKDGFLTKVREELKERGLLETRAIVVSADGSWKIKEEKREGERSKSLEREIRDAEKAASAGSVVKDKAKPKAAPVVIELD